MDSCFSLFNYLGPHFPTIRNSFSPPLKEKFITPSKSFICKYKYIDIIKGNGRNKVCRYSEFHVTHATIFSLLITLYHNGAIQ